MDNFKREQHKISAQARAAVAATAGFADIDIFDDAALAAALLSLPEAARTPLHSPLTRLFNDAHWRIRDDDALGLAFTRAWHVMLVGTASPTRRDFSPIASPSDHLLESVPHALVDLWNARPTAVRERMVRHWWEEPSWGGYPSQWLLWRALTRAGALPESTSPNYGIGALSTLERQLPAEVVDGTLTPVPERGIPAVARLLETDPGIGALAEAGIAAEAHDAWIIPGQRAVLARVGAVDAEIMIADSLSRLTRAIPRDCASNRRALIDLLAEDVSVLARHETALTRIVANGQPADQAWGTVKLGELLKADMLSEPGAVIDALEPAMTGLSLEGVKRALGFAVAVGVDEHLRIAAAGLAHSKLGAQQAAWRIIGAQCADTAQAALVDAVRENRPTLLPAVASLAEAWLKEAAPGDQFEANVAEEAAPATHRVDEPVAAPGVDELVAISSRLSARAAEPFDLDFLLAIIASSGRGQAKAERAEILRRARDKAGAITSPPQLPGHVWDSVLAWLEGAVPGSLPAVGHERGVFRGPRLTYGSTTVSPTAAFPTGWPGPQKMSACSHIGVTGLWCARAWEAAYAGASSPGTLLATPTHVSGSISPEAFAARLAHAIPGPLRFDAIAALLRLDPVCDDPALIAVARASDHPAAAAALALWGHGDIAVVADWLLPTLTGRRSVLHEPTVRATTYPNSGGYQPASHRTAGPVVVWPGAPDQLRVTDPLGALAYQRGPEGIATRPSADGEGRPRALIDTSDIASAGSPYRAAPWDTDAVAASLASWIVRDEGSPSTWYAMEEWMSPLLRLPVTPGHGWNTLTCVALVYGHPGLKAAAVDALAADLGLDAIAMGAMLAHLLNAGMPGATRAADALREAAEASGAGARAAARIVESAVATLTGSHRDLGRLLETWEIACARSGARVVGGTARAALEAASAGSSRRAAAAKRLLAL